MRLLQGNNIAVLVIVQAETSAREHAGDVDSPSRMDGKLVSGQLQPSAKSRP